MIGALNPRDRAAEFLEIGGGAVQIGLVKGLEAENLDRAGLVGFLQDHAMMPALFHRPQIEVAVGLIGDLQSQNLGVEFARGGQIGDVQADVAQADGVEIRVEIGAGMGMDCSYCTGKMTLV